MPQKKGTSLKLKQLNRKSIIAYLPLTNN